MHLIQLPATEIEARLRRIPEGGWHEVVPEIADDTFKPESIKAQSGRAVAQAIANTVQFTVQELDADQQTQARENIGAISDGDLELKLSNFKLFEELTEEELKTFKKETASDIADLKSQLAELLYEPIAISGFTHNAGTKEMGATVTDVTLSWSINKIPALLSLDGEAIDVSSAGKALSGLSITYDNNKTWKLIATEADAKGATSTKTTSITFCNGIYYGVGIVENSFTSDFVTGLSKQLQTAKAYDFTVNPADQYIYYAVPKRLGTVKFKVGGFEGGFQTPETVSVTNGSNFTEDYYVYRSTNKITGSTSVDVT